MRYLIDTQILIWASHGMDIPAKIAHILNDNKQEIFVSVASLWEMAIKSSIGKLQIDRTLFDRLEAHNYILLPILIPHLHAVAALPHHHKDPFDRLLIAQAIHEKLTLITSDDALKQYDAKIILA